MNTKKIIFFTGIINFVIAIIPLYIIFFGNSSIGRDALVPTAVSLWWVETLFWVYLVILLFPLPSIFLSKKTENRRKNIILLSINIFSMLVIATSCFWWFMFVSMWSGV